MYTLKFASWFDGRIRQFFLRKKKTVEHQINLSDCGYPFIPLGRERRLKSEVHY